MVQATSASCNQTTGQGPQPDCPNSNCAQSMMVSPGPTKWPNGKLAKWPTPLHHYAPTVETSQPTRQTKQRLHEHEPRPDWATLVPRDHRAREITRARGWMVPGHCTSGVERTC
jgi:hypothetical protein